MRVFLYARCSMDEIGTEREQNPEAQLGPMREEVLKRGWTNAGEFTDLESGGEIRREQFGVMLRRVGQKEADLVMVWKADRFSRLEPMETIVILYQIQTFGCGFYSLTEPYISSLEDNPIPNEWRLPVISMVFAGGYSEKKKISQRTKAGIAAKRLTGQWHGGRPKGSLDKEQRKPKRFRAEMKATDLFKPV